MKADLRLFVASARMQELLLRAKHLLFAAMLMAARICPARLPRRCPSPRDRRTSRRWYSRRPWRSSRSPPAAAPCCPCDVAADVRCRRRAHVSDCLDLAFALAHRKWQAARPTDTDDVSRVEDGQALASRLARSVGPRWRTRALSTTLSLRAADPRPWPPRGEHPPPHKPRALLAALGRVLRVGTATKILAQILPGRRSALARACGPVGRPLFQCILGRDRLRPDATVPRAAGRGERHRRPA